MENKKTKMELLNMTARNDYNNFMMKVKEKSKDEIISLAYEIAIKSDIMYAISEATFTDEEAMRLILIDDIIDYTYKKWEAIEDKYMEDIHCLVENL